MIINEMTLKIKNIIFFKFVFFTFIISIIFYQISLSNISNEEIKAKIYRTNQLVVESEERLRVLESENDNLKEAIAEYHNLKNTINLSDLDCFNKLDYEKKIRNIESQFNLKSKTNIFASSNSIIKKDQPKKSVVLKTTTVKLSYNIDNFHNAIKYALNAYNLLPQYNLVRSIEITKESVITPTIASLINNDNNSFFIDVNLNLEVKELNLND
jgi:hypothetical protein